MYKHILNEHEGKSHGVNFEWGIVGKFVKPLERQLSEAICIEKTPMQESLNTKQEYFHHNVRRIGFNENEHQCNYCSRRVQSVVELEKHENHVHIRLNCNKFDYVSFGKRDLKEHTDMKHEKRVHDNCRCLICGYLSTSEKELKDHTDMKHEKPVHDNVDVQIVNNSPVISKV